MYLTQGHSQSQVKETRSPDLRQQRPREKEKWKNKPKEADWQRSG